MIKNFTSSLVLLLLLAACAPRPASTPTATPSTAPSPSATSPIAPAAEAYLEEAIAVMQEHSYYRAGVDWEAVRAEALRLAVSDQVPADTYNVIEYLLAYEIEDPHAYLLPPEQVEQYSQADLGDSPAPFAALVQERFGYISVPMFASGDLEVVNQFAADLQQLIRDIDARAPCGWVVDLRADGGGNMWAMLAGLGPILGEGKLGAFDYGDGLTFDWVYRDGSITADDGTLIGVPGPGYLLANPGAPVAVLTGRYTLSSGEAVTVAFRGRPNTRSFGQPTGGYATAIELFPLSDGALLGVTTALFADRDGTVYTGWIPPDEEVSTSLGVPVSEGVYVPQAALDWLASQPACSK